jgi:hypothetical protein
LKKTVAFLHAVVVLYAGAMRVVFSIPELLSTVLRGIS